MQSLIGTEWSPGINAPFDPIAAKLAKKLDLTVIVANGKSFKNLENILDGNAFKGTVIMPYKIDAEYYDREYYHGGKNKGLRTVIRRSFLGTLLRAFVNWYRAFIIKVFINPKNVLDVGCGQGDLIRALRSFNIEAQGVEISKDALELVPAEIAPYVKYGDITNLPYEDNAFDLVVTFDVLEHVEQNKIQKAIDELIRVSKKHILNKIFTKENGYMRRFHRRDFSRVSIFSKKFWQRIFAENDKVIVLRNSFFRLPSYFETVFLMRKK
jgi:ubiquinone/menaquinone biosynthesis C-methylase UbiE